MKKIKRLAAFLLAGCLLMGCGAAAAAEVDGDYATAYYNSIFSGLLRNYKFEADGLAIARAVATAALQEHPELLESLIDATADGFDKFTDYYTPEEMLEFTTSLNEEYVGIGVSIQRASGAVEIASVFVGGPADVAGLRAGDKILKVDDRDVTDCTVNELVELVRGESGTTVQLTVGREEETLTVSVTRAAVNEHSVSYSIMDNGMGYMRISVFNGTTAGEVAEADAFFRDRKVKKLIIDLRDNPGGDLLSVVNCLGFFVPQGKTVVTIDYKDPDKKYSMRSVGDVKTPYYKLAVLINENSASGAELFAGNIRDYKLGTLVGVTSYGKGTVQEFMRLHNTPDQAMGQIKLTVAEYILPNGDCVNKVGIKPDIWVANHKELLNTDEMAEMEFGPDYGEGTVGNGVLALKQRFEAMGYFVGEVNDQYDRELTLAVKQFQEAAGLPTSGIMDMDTQTMFANVVREVRVLIDDQLEEAIGQLEKK